MQVQLPSLHRLNACTSLILKTALLIWALLALSAVFLMSLGTDEAWVLSGLRSLLRPNVPDLTTELNVTNGGPFALVNLGVEAWLGGQLWAHRLVSAIAMAGSFALVLIPGRTLDTRSRSCWLAMSVLLCVPGIAEVGSAALGTSVGLFLMLASMRVWTSPAAGAPWVRAICCGVLYGMAAASRFDLLLFGLAVLLASNLRVSDSRGVEFKPHIPSFLFVGLGLALFAAHLWIMGLSANATPPEVTGAVTGVSGWRLNYPKLLNQWQTLGTIVPAGLLAAFAIGSLWVISPGQDPEADRHARFEILLVVTGAVLLTAWIFRAPIPHLRYALPALFCLAAAGALALQDVALRQAISGDLRKLLLCQFFCLACAIGGIASLTRSVVLSDSDFVSWEWSNEMGSDYFRRFEARADQRKIAEYVRHVDPAARLYSTIPFALRYLAERPVVDLVQPLDNEAAASVQRPKRVLILTPATGTYLYLRPESVAWLEHNSRMTMQIGRYSVYELASGTDKDMEHLVFDRTAYRAHPDSRPGIGQR